MKPTNKPDSNASAAAEDSAVSTDTAASNAAPAEAASTSPAAESPQGESRAQRDAKRQGAEMKKAVATDEVRAIQAGLQAQSEDAANFDPRHRTPRREFDSNGTPQSNPRTRARSAR